MYKLFSYFRPQKRNWALYGNVYQYKLLKGKMCILTTDVVATATIIIAISSKFVKNKIYNKFFRRI